MLVLSYASYAFLILTVQEGSNVVFISFVPLLIIGLYLGYQVVLALLSFYLNPASMLSSNPILTAEILLANGMKPRVEGRWIRDLADPSYLSTAEPPTRASALNVGISCIAAASRVWFIWGIVAASFTWAITMLILDKAINDRSGKINDWSLFVGNEAFPE